MLAGAMAVASARAGGPEPAQAQPAAPAAPAATQPNLDSYVQSLTTSLRQGPAQQHYEAAQRLLEVGNSAALAQFQNALSSNDPAAQLACAKAASEAANPDPNWTTPLAGLLGKDRALTEAAALALARLDTEQSAAALTRFVQLANRPYRAAAVPAMGRIVRKPVAQALVTIVDDPLEPRDVSSAASQALTQISGTGSPPEDPAAWRQWWNARANLPDAQWRARVIEEQHQRLETDRDRSRERLAKQSVSIQTLVRAQYDLRPTERPRVLLGFLDDADPAVRAAGAGIVPDAVSQGHIVPQEVRARLIELIGDASPDVRIKVAQALAKLADPNALNPLLRQIAIEKDLQVKVALISAIAVANDPHAVDALRGLLQNSSAEVAAAAADALRTLAPALQQNNPQQADQIYGELKKVLVDRTGPPGQPVAGLPATDLRVALLGALTPLAGHHSQEMTDFLPGFLNQSENPRVRAATMDTLAPLGDAGGSYMVQALGAEPDPTVRAAAARALGMTHVFRFAAQLYGMSRDENDPGVRAAAWVGFSSLLPYGDAPQLIQWAQELHQQREWEKEVVVLRQFCEKMDPADKKQAISLAQERESIGDLYLQKFEPPQPDQAIGYYRDALAFWQDPKNPQPTRPGLVARLMEAYLGARQYQQALRFGADQIHLDTRNQSDVGRTIRNAAENLKNSKNPADWAAARELIDGALDMQPGQLDAYAQTALREIRSQLPEPPATNPAR
jgi:HEAT repeat protein